MSGDKRIYAIYYLFLFVCLASLHRMWDLSSPTRGCSLSWQSRVLTIGPPGKSPIFVKRKKKLSYRGLCMCYRLF